MFKKGFTLVKLAIVVAIIGILAAIAIPNFVEMQYRAKRAEVPANVDGLKTAEMGYDAAFDEFISAAQHPTSDPGKSAIDWDNGAIPAGYVTLGWAPDGQVRAYQVTTTAPSTTNPGGDFLITGICDVDGDDTNANYTATKSINAVQNTANNIY